MKNKHIPVLNGFLVKEFSTERDFGRHWFIKMDGKKYAIFGFQYNKKDFKNRYPNLIIRNITQTTALKILKESGEDIVEIGKLGKSTADEIFDWPS